MQKVSAIIEFSHRHFELVKSSGDHTNKLGNKVSDTDFELTCVFVSPQDIPGRFMMLHEGTKVPSINSLLLILISLDNPYLHVVEESFKYPH